MLKVKELDRERAPFPLAAVLDARMRNHVGASLHTAAKKLKAEQMKLALDMVYTTTGIYINYRKKFITIKVADADVADRKGLRLLEQDWAQLGVTKLQTAQGIIYRLPA